MGKLIIILEMKILRNTLSIALVVASLFSSCEKDLLNIEHYKPVIYMKSGDNNIFAYPHALNDSISTGYVTVGSGGSMPLTEDVMVTVGMNNDLLDTYNYRQFGDDINKHARLLSSERFVIPSSKIIIKAGDVDAATFFPIEVDANGLSSDTTYIIPLEIKSVDKHEVNPEKNFVLYKIDLVNAYSSPTSNMYKMRGTKYPEGGIKSNITTNKKIIPISKNAVRLFPENLASSTNLRTIENTAILLIINSDNSVRVKSYKNIEIEQLEECKYDPVEKIFTINYRYHLPGESKWTTIMEMLYRIE